MKPLWPDSGGIPPQHRQLADAYAEALVATAFGACAPSGWGVSRLAVTYDAAVVRVTQLEGRFESGIAVLHADDALVRTLATSTGTVTVHVGIAKAAAAAPGVTEDAGTSATRHLRGRGYLQPNLRLLLGDECAESHERIAVAHFVHGTLDTTFSPPLLRVMPGSAIADGTRAIVAALVARQRSLLEPRAARPLNLRALQPTAAPQLLALSAINQALASLRDELPPRVLHRELAELLGALSGIGGDASPPPSYVHESPGSGFALLTRRLLEVIPSVGREPHAAFPLTRRDSVTYSLELGDPEAFRRGVYLVASGAEENVVSTLLPGYAKIASAALLPSIVRQAIRGVPIALEFDAPASLPSSSKHCCFKIDTRCDLWRDVLEQRSVAVHVPEAPRDLALTAYVLT